VGSDALQLNSQVYSPFPKSLFMPRRFPPPWTVEALDGGFKIVDSNGQALAYVYGHADPRDAGIAKSLTLDEARRIASKSPSSRTWRLG
jgi:hypothetical protein